MELFGAGTPSFAETMTNDASFSGTGQYDADGDNVKDSSDVWTTVDCGTVIVP